jgi:hypothetical protein
MKAQILDLAGYAAARAWVVLVALTALTAIKLVALTGAPEAAPAHPERVVVAIR